MRLVSRLKRWLSTLGMAGIMLLSVPVRAADVLVSAPAFIPDAGQPFEVEIIVDVGSDALGSYFLNLGYDPAIVNIVSVTGGNAAAFGTPPNTDPLTFTSGVTPIAFAQNTMTSPTGTFSVATVTLNGVGIAGAVSPLTLEVFELNDGVAAPLVANSFDGSVQLNFTGTLDTDSDGLTDVEEAINVGTDINNPDTDGDGLSDGFEVAGGLDPFDDGTTVSSQAPSADPDGDGLTSLQEQTWNTNPTLADTDGDGIIDGAEVALGTGATVPDSDTDGLPDGFEVNGGLDPLDDGTTNVDNGATGDPDGDGLDNAAELAAGSHPNNGDTDADGLPDNYEVANTLDPADDGTFDINQGAAGDPDQDGDNNLAEFNLGSNPRDVRSQAVNTQLNLVPGLQPLFYPLDMPVGFSAFDLLTTLNAGGDVVASVQSFEAGGVVRTANWSGGSPSGEDFILAPGQGVMAQVSSPASLPFQGAVSCANIDLHAGLNIVGLKCSYPGMFSDQFLAGVGTSLAVGAIENFNPDTGSFEAVTFEDDEPRGTLFSVQRSNAYLLHMLTDQPGYDPLQ